MRIFVAILFLALSLLSTKFSQAQNKYQGLLWEVTADAGQDPSYLYGTMHVSKKVAFHLNDTFFYALKNVDVIGLETSPETWLTDMMSSRMMNGSSVPKKVNLYQEAFKFTMPENKDFASMISREQNMINSLLYRYTNYNTEFEENTYLDLFIYQAGKKQGKKVLSMENFDTMLEMANKAQIPDENPKEKSKTAFSKELKNRSLRELIEDCYREGNLDLLDSIQRHTSSKNSYKWMLVERNRVMANNMDSVIKAGESIFTGVGAAHLAGRDGMIEMLRAKGYSVRPVSRVHLNKSGKQKEKIDKQIASTSFKRYFSSDSIFSVEVPYPLVNTPSYREGKSEYFTADMANGAHYTISRIFHHAPLKDQSSKIMMKRVDSLLFENIPGKMVKKKEILIGGFPAYEIINKTKSGNFQQYRIVVTPLELLVFKMGGLNGFAKGKDAVKFFSSIEINYPKVDNWKKLQPTYGDFSINFPNIHIAREKQLKIDNGQQQQFLAYGLDTKSGNYYTMMKALYFDHYYIEEDTFELRAVSETHFKEMGFKTSKKEVSYTKEGFPQMNMKCISQDSTKYLFLRTLIKGSNYYLMSVFTKEDRRPDQFFESFSFEDIHYPDTLKEHNDTALFYSIKTIGRAAVKETPRNYGRYSTGKKKKKEDLQYQSTNISNTFVVNSTGEQIKVKFFKHNDFYHRDDWKEFWDVKKGLIIDDHTLVIRKEKYGENEKDSIWTLDLELVDTGSIRGIMVHMEQHHGQVYKLFANFDTITGPSKFVTEFFSKFDPIDTAIGTFVLDDKIPALLNDVMTEDSASLDRAVDILDESSKALHPRYKQKHLPLLLKAIKEQKFTDDHGLNPRAELIEDLSAFEAHTVIKTLEGLYQEAEDTTTLQLAVLRALTKLQDQKASEKFIELLAQETPLPSENYAINNLFLPYYDSLELAIPLFPELFEYTTYPEYESAVISLLTSCYEDTLIAKDVYLKQKKKFLKKAGEEFKRHLSAQENTSGSGKSRYNYSSGSEHSEEMIRYYAKLLSPFSKESSIKSFYDKIIQTPDNNFKLELTKIFLKYNIEIEDSIIKNLAKNDETRIKFYDILEEQEKLALFDSSYLNQLDFARGLLVDHKNLDLKKDSILYLERKEPVFAKEMEGYIYLFKIKKSYDKSWKIAYVYQPKERDSTTTQRKIVTTGVRITRDDDLEEVIEKGMERFFFKDRNRYQRSYNYGGNYNLF